MIDSSDEVRDLITAERSCNVHNTKLGTERLCDEIRSFLAGAGGGGEGTCSRFSINLRKAAISTRRGACSRVWVNLRKAAISPRSGRSRKGTTTQEKAATHNVRESTCS